MLRYLLLAAFLAAGLTALCQSNCTDPAASNFNPMASVDDGSCVYCTPDEVAVMVAMTDYFGDGWNGSFYSLTDVSTGTVIQTGSLDQALVGNGLTSGLDAFCISSACALYTVDGSQGDVGGTTTEVFLADGTILASSTGLFGPYLVGLPVPSGPCSAGGCTDPQCANYSPFATEDDGSCICIDCPGDLDGSGVVSVDDLLPILGNFGTDQCAWPCPRDLDNNGVGGVGDVLIFLDLFQTTCP